MRLDGLGGDDDVSVVLRRAPADNVPDASGGAGDEQGFASEVGQDSLYMEVSF